MLDAVIVGCLVAAGVSLAFAIYALLKEKATADEIKKALKELLDAAKADAKVVATPAGADAQALQQQNQAHAGLASIGEVLKGVGTAAEGVSKLKTSVAGLFMALMFLVLAGGLASVDDKVVDKEDKKPEQTATG